MLMKFANAFTPVTAKICQLESYWRATVVTMAEPALF
jgi:hypothetical protein